MPKLARYFVVYHVAALVIYTSWAFAGTRVAWLWPMFWLTLGVIEAMVLLPAVRAGETLGDARSRVVRALVFDPLLALCVALVVFLIFQGFNGPRALVYLGVNQGWQMGPPPLPGLPSSVVTQEAVQLLAWFPPAIIAALAVRHAINANGRRLLLRILIWNAAALALSGCVQMALGCRAIYGMIPIQAQFFSSFGYPNHAGAFFTFMLVVASGFWLYEREDEVPGADRLLWAVFLLYGAAVLCLCRTSILMGTAVLLVGGAFAITRIWRRLDLGTRVMVAGLSVLLPLMGVLSFFVMPSNPIRRELTGLTMARMFKEVYERAFELLVPAALTIWRDNPIYGVGGWGFRHFVPLVLTPEQYKKLFVGAANVHNDSVNFLVEHGIVGTALLVLAGVTLLVPLLRRVSPPPHGHLFPMHGSAGLFRWFVLCALGLVLCHSLIDLPFRCPAVIQAVLLSLALAGTMCREAREKS
jgi:O-antigen ligase